MILSDKDIQHELTSGSLIIDPSPTQLQPASIELHLGKEFKKIDPWAELDPLMDNSEFIYTQTYFQKFRIKPHQFVLAHTVETVTIPNGMVGRVEGKSSLGRLGLTVHVTAGFIDPGFSGQITLELVNDNPDNLILLTPGMKICQLSLAYTNTKSVNPYGHPSYGSHYQHQTGANPSRSLINDD